MLCYYPAPEENKIEDPTSILRAMPEGIPAPDGEMDAQGIVEVVSANLEETLSFYRALGFDVEQRTGPFAVMEGFGLRLFMAENLDAPADRRWANVRVMVPGVNLVWSALMPSVCRPVT